MKESSNVEHEASRRLHRMLASIATQIEGDLSRICESPEGGIHSLRRRMKKLGSILKLVRKHVSPGKKKQIKRLIHLLKDAFAGQRDADVMRKLAAGFGIPEKAHARTQPARSRRANVNARHLQAAAKLRALICGLSLQKLTWKQVAAEFLRTHRQEEKAWMAACEKTTAETLHVWRKKTKQLFYQMLLIHQITGRMRKPVKLADSIGRWQGRHHDLDVFASVLKQRAGTGWWLKKISRRQKKLSRRIFRAADIFHDKTLAKKLKHTTLA